MRTGDRVYVEGKGYGTYVGWFSATEAGRRRRTWTLVDFAGQRAYVPTEDVVHIELEVKGEGHAELP